MTIAVANILLILQLITIIITISSSSSTAISCHSDDREALLGIKSSFGANPFDDYWVGRNCCDWTNVECSKHTGRVISLDLFPVIHNLTGPFPSSHLCNLTSLRHLWVDSSAGGTRSWAYTSRYSLRSIPVSQLSGSIPSCICTRLSHLQELRIIGNNLTGSSIPTCLSNLTALLSLDLQYNSLAGSIPPSICSLSKLQYLVLDGNPFTSSTLPSCLGQISQLQELSCNSCGLNGGIPPSLGNLSQLQSLDLSYNHLQGSIPATLGMLSSIQLISLEGNELEGSIPASLGNVSTLETLYLHFNLLTGGIPDTLSNLGGVISSLSFGFNHLKVDKIPDWLFRLPFLTSLDLSSCDLRGKLNVCGFSGPNSSQIVSLDLSHNHLQGSIPSCFGNLTDLRILNISSNQLDSVLPSSLSRLSDIYQLDLHNNSLEGPLPSNWIANASSLSQMDFSNNYFIGNLPPAIANLTSFFYLTVSGNWLSGDSDVFAVDWGDQLQVLDMSNNFFSGLVPPNLARCNYLQRLKLGGNLFKFGASPWQFRNLSGLQTLSISQSNLMGPVPESLVNCTDLVVLDLHQNQLSGSFPVLLKTMGNLRVLDLSYNQLGGAIPEWMGNFSQSLQVVDLSHNKFTGTIPNNLRLPAFKVTQDDDVMGLKTLYEDFVVISAKGRDLTYTYILSVLISFDVSGNFLEGSIPPSLGDLKGMQFLNLSNNRLAGYLPSMLANLLQLQSLDISHNSLEGQIPSSFSKFSKLAYFNVSGNNLSGPIPQEGQMTTFLNDSYVPGNNGLCGYPLQNCPSLAPSRKNPDQKRNHRVRNTALICVSSITFLFLCMAMAVWAYQWFRRRGRTGRGIMKLNPRGGLRTFTAADLFSATNGYSSDCIIGSGGSSTVYKAIFDNAETLVVKRFKMEDLSKEQARRLFVRECQTLGKVRHRNLVKILGCCCNFEMAALILQYMPNGSLETHLHHPQPSNLTWENRFHIAIGVANALAYLHHKCGEIGAIIHCDLKPSNILMDHDFEAYVTDFGMARIVCPGSQSLHASISAFGGTIGYAAPEYASTLRATAAGDVYSYGIIILEIVTGKRPTSDTFDQGVTLRGWVQSGTLEEAIDQALQAQAEVGTNEVAVLVQLLKIGLLCTRRSPKDRLTMRDVLNRLLEIKAGVNAPSILHNSQGASLNHNPHSLAKFLACRCS